MEARNHCNHCVAPGVVSNDLHTCEEKMEEFTATEEVLSQTYSLRGAARYCDVSPNTVRNWLLTGRLKQIKDKGRVFILQSDLDKIIEQRKLESQSNAVSD
jgi:transposase-like protein